MTNAQALMLSAWRSMGTGGREERAGSGGIKVLCCFHSEKTPSLVIYPDHVTCYGACDETWSAAGFLRLTRFAHIVDNSEAYREAYDLLEDGLPLRGMSRPRRSYFDRWEEEAARLRESDHPPTPAECDVMELARLLYAQSLASRTCLSAVVYAEQRGLIDPGGTPRDGVGYCAGRDLAITLVTQRNDALITAAQKLGLLSRTDAARDRLAGRLVIPDLDAHGRTVWMTARAVPGLVPAEIEKQRKYLHLSVQKTLFGAAQATGKEVIVVEGQMCVLALRRLGISAVALGGLHLSERFLPWFYGKTVLLCLDTPRTDKERALLDGALSKIKGQLAGFAHATEKVTLPDDVKDPDSYIQTYGVFPL
jgi:DNA primase